MLELRVHTLWYLGGYDPRVGENIFHHSELVAMCESFQLKHITVNTRKHRRSFFAVHTSQLEDISPQGFLFAVVHTRAGALWNRSLGSLARRSTYVKYMLQPFSTFGNAPSAVAQRCLPF
jgi:hypothetical protein